MRAVFDDITRTRKVDDVNNVWKALANHPAPLKRTWESACDPVSERVREADVALKPRLAVGHSS